MSSPYPEGLFPGSPTNTSRQRTLLSTLKIAARSPQAKALRRRVATLGLLYRQAVGVYFLAEGKIRLWCSGEGRGSGAMMPIKQPNGEADLVRVGGAEHRQAQGEETRMAALKGVARASEKLMRAYKADASRLLDVCRFALVFESTNEIADLLDVIRCDPDVAVVAVKNRMREGHSAKQSAGFRDVHINLVMKGGEAERLGVSSHVWELQLMVASVCKLRSHGGHQRYVQYRDLRAE